VHSIYVIDDDVVSSRSVAHSLERAGHSAHVAATGRAAIEMAVEKRPQLILCEFSLPDVSGLEVLKALRRNSIEAPLIMLSASSSVRNVAEAMKRGATDFLEKPIAVASLLSAVEEALNIRRPLSALAISPEAHSIERWADVVIRAVQCHRDPKTLQAWARSIGVSFGALRMWCRIAGVKPKQSLNFARLLRAVILHSQRGTRFEDSLDVVDQRTLKKLLTCANVETFDTMTVETFLGRQGFVSSDSLMKVIRQRLH
jgi:DNA-binding response OmpR family regulator